MPTIKGSSSVSDSHFGAGRKKRNLKSNLDSEYAPGGRLDIPKSEKLSKKDLAKYYKRNQVNDTYVRNEISRTGKLLQFDKQREPEWERQKRQMD